MATKHYYKAEHAWLLAEDESPACFIFSTAEAGRKWLELTLEELRQEKYSSVTSWQDVSCIRNWCSAHVAAYDIFFEGSSEPETIYLEECEFDDLTEA